MQANDTQYWVDIDESNAKALVVDESFTRLVVIDFWADWCGSCRNLMPILERLAAEYGGRFLLAKINVDQQQMLAAQFGVRSLPAVIVMRDGQPIDGLSGAQRESEVHKLLGKYLSKPEDDLLEQGKSLLADNNPAEALPLLREAYAMSRQRGDIACVLAETLLLTLQYDEADQVLNAVRPFDQDAHYWQLVAQAKLARRPAKTSEIIQLEKEHQADPENLDVAYRLALQYHQLQYMRESLELLYGILRKDRYYRDGAVRKSLMDIIAMLGQGDPLAIEFQRKVYTMLY